jgi:hypothetical protein
MHRDDSPGRPAGAVLFSERVGSLVVMLRGPRFITRACEILDSYRRRLGHDLFERSGDAAEDARRLFDLPLAVLAHDTAPQPLLDWANLAAARAFDATPESLLGRPSAGTTPADAVADRRALFDVLARQGFVTGYSGVRISLTGRRFVIDDVTVLEVTDATGQPAGHAAAIGSTRAADA